VSITFKIFAGQSGIVKDMNKIVEHESLDSVGLFTDISVLVRLVETELPYCSSDVIIHHNGITTTQRPDY